MNTPSLETDPLDALAEAFLERFRAGERPSLSEYTRQHPELAERIHRLFPALVMLEELGSVAKQAEAPAIGVGSDSSKVPSQLGEYHILREIGRGGMGVVYEAVQESLGRHVALKVLPYNRLVSATYLERFQREARAAAGLHHTNIVPVFGVGEHGGLHYYAMQFIHGQPVDAVLREVQRLRAAKGTPTNEPTDFSLAGSVARSLLTGGFPDDGPRGQQQASVTTIGNPGSKADAKVGAGTEAPLSDSQSQLSNQTEAQYFRSVARLGIQVAEALAYAHRHGILHRDIKPANLLLDTAGQVWVTDFGLAKAEDSEELTSPGDLVGTLRYMAPERFQGKSDARSDVYGLGITLYEMLTLRLAFAEGDRARVMAQITHADPPRPCKLDRQIPRDLETAVLKAIAKAPAERYATAEAFAEDLRRFLADRPIQARRTSVLERGWRWCRRNRAVAALIALAAVFVIVIAIVSSVAALWLGQAWQVAENRAEQLRQDLESLQAANTLVETGGADAFSRQWDKAEANFAQAALRRPDHALAWRVRRDLHARLGLWDLAANDSLQALKVLEPAYPQFWYEHAVLCLYLGDTRGYRQACARIVERFGDTTDPRCADIVARPCLLVPDPVVDPKRLITLGERGCGDGSKCWRVYTLGAAHYRAGHYEQAISFLRVSLSKVWPGRALNHAVLAMACHRLGQAGEAQQELENARRVIDQLTREMLQHELGERPENWGDWLESLLLFREAKLLLDGRPPPEDSRLHLARARAFAALKDKDRAGAACARAVELDPTSVAIRLECSLLHGDLGQWDKALPYLSKAMELQGRDASLGSWWFPLAIAHWHVGEKDKALHWYGRASEWMAKNRPRDAKLRRLRAEATDLLGIQDHRRLSGHTEQVRSVVFSPDGTRALSGGYDWTLRLWDVAGGKELRCFTGHDGWVWSVALSRDGRRALSGSADTSMRLWDVETGQRLCRFQHPGWVMAVAFSPDGRCALAGSYGTVHLWDLESGKELRRWECGPGHVRSVAFSPDGRLALSGDEDKTVRLWDLATRNEIRRLTGHQNAVLSVAFSPDGRRMLSGGCDRTVRLWDVGSGEQLGCFRGHHWNVESVAFSPDGRWGLSGGADGTIRLWQLPAGREMYCIGTEDVLGVAFSPDGRQVLSAHADNIVRLWNLPRPDQR